MYSLAVIKTISETESHYNLTEQINQRITTVEKYVADLHTAINQANSAVITNILIIAIVMISAVIISNIFLIKSFQKNRQELKEIKQVLENFSQVNNEKDSSQKQSVAENNTDKPVNIPDKD